MTHGHSAPADPVSVVLSGPDVARVTDRIAHQIIEHVAKGGFNEVFAGISLPVGSLDITLYRDDLRLRGVRPLGETSEPEGGIDGRTVVLVDDVLYSGRTCRAALDALTELGRPGVVQLAALVDRGHRQLPIRADYVGKNLPTSPTQQVRVLLQEIDGEDAVLVEGS
jgi:pyrimidine operon attenuation protein / uracil phosphoribosyltransferase